MKSSVTKRRIVFGFLSGLAAFAGCPFFAQGQVVTSSIIQVPSSVELPFWQGQQTLREDIGALQAAGETDDQIDAWRQQNALLIKNQLQLDGLMAAYSYFQPMDYVAAVNVFSSASQDMDDFVVAQAGLYNNLAQIHNQLAQAGAGAISVQTADTLADTEEARFQLQNRAVLESQAQRIQRITDQLSHQPEEVPGSPPVAKASPQAASYRLLSYQLDCEEVALHNQYCAGDLHQMDAIIEQWRKNNAARFQQLRVLAQSLIPSNQN